MAPKTVKIVWVFALLMAVDGAALSKNVGPSRRDYDELLKSNGSDESITEFLRKLPVIREPGPNGRLLYIIEGDALLGEEEARSIIRSWFPSTRVGSGLLGPELNILTQNGKDAVWPQGSRHLTYTVDAASFGDPNRAKVVIDNIAAAARAWIEICPSCDIQFSQTGPGGRSTNDPHFTVTYEPEATSYFALAFSPFTPGSGRQIKISPLYFASKYDKVGLLRHELGHVLGYRHERINGVPGCALEDNGNWRAITPPDDLSVMHYTCGNNDEVGHGVLSLSLTRTDVEGHQKTYGAPR